MDTGFSIVRIECLRVSKPNKNCYPVIKHSVNWN